MNIDIKLEISIKDQSVELSLEEVEQLRNNLSVILDKTKVFKQEDVPVYMTETAPLHMNIRQNATMYFWPVEGEDFSDEE